MKRNILLFFSLLIVNYFNAQSLFVDDFSYGTGNLVGNGSWAAHSGAGSNAIQVISGSLSYTGYANSGSGNSIQAIMGSGSREDVNHAFTAQNSGTVYTSFLISVSGGNNQTYFYHFNNSGFRGNIFVGSSGVGGDFDLGIRASATSSPVKTGISLSFSTTYLVVMSYNIDTGVANLWVFSGGTLPSTEPAAHATDTGTSGTTIDEVSVRQASGDATIQIDGIRVGTSWNNAPLPVEYKRFTAQEKNGKVELNWSTLSENENDYFSIEHSTDGYTFSEIGRKAGAGDSFQELHYSFLHSFPTKGSNYYRLKQTDFDGKYTYSSVVSLALKEQPDIRVYPNPFQEQVHISFDEELDETAFVEIYDLAGQVQFRKTVGAGSLQQTLSMESLPTGMYVLKVRSDRSYQTKRVFKR